MAGNEFSDVATKPLTLILNGQDIEEMTPERLRFELRSAIALINRLSEMLPKK